ncbi:hypothetical protein [Aeoliella mucimassa]|uniref:Uncharacterized protein n=1 Tax=Aeoliella mucimassa TaxID=2527972 RepID=A0A518AJU5_9BACT|nr:hypothetical protein [Aeoliella mucimassa]QDU54944.1 hypothetical protein Pan181_11290 [Aeoliella mucimassa]
MMLVVSACIPVAVHYYRYYDYPQYFITQLGEYQFLDDSRVLELYEEDGYINYRFKTGGKSRGTSKASIPKGSPWFAFVETRNRVWIYDGVDDLVLLSNSEKQRGTYSIKVCGDWLIQQIPPEVTSRLPNLLDNSKSSETNNVDAASGE